MIDRLGWPSVGSVGECLDAETRRVYVRALRALAEAGVDFMVGGAHALAAYTGVVRDTKDLDVFLHGRDCESALASLRQAGFETELTFPHWLGKAYDGHRFIDLIFSSGNGVARVDDLWFVHAMAGEVLSTPVLLCPIEEMIWSKAFIMERERYDGADIAHLLLACGPQLDWERLLERFGPQWRVLLSHLILFGFIYPDSRRAIPGTVMKDLMHRLEREESERPAATTPENGGEAVCDGTLLSRQQYLVDVIERGYTDGRLAPRGPMTTADIAHWTAAIAPGPPDPSGPIPSNGRPGRARRRRR